VIVAQGAELEPAIAQIHPRLSSHTAQPAATAGDRDAAAARGRVGGVLCAFSCVLDALPEQCLRRRPGIDLLVAVVFRNKRLLRERCAATCLRRRRPGRARRRQGRLQITAWTVAGLSGAERLKSADQVDLASPGAWLTGRCPGGAPAATLPRSEACRDRRDFCRVARRGSQISQAAPPADAAPAPACL
jgi:hypothetical protein